MRLGWYWTASASFPWECPTIEAQLQACTWAEREAAAALSRQLANQGAMKAQASFPWESQPILTPAQVRGGISLQLANQRTMKAQADALQREASLIQQDLLQQDLVQQKAFARGNSWWKRQAPPPAQVMNHNDPAFGETTVVTSTDWVAANGVHAHLRQTPPKQRTVTVPRRFKLKDTRYTPFTPVGPHRCAYNFTTDLFTCEDCGVAFQVMRDFARVPTCVQSLKRVEK